MQQRPIFRVGQNHTFTGKIRCTYGIFSREITMHTVIYGADIRFWPTLPIFLPKNQRNLFALRSNLRAIRFCRPLLFGWSSCYTCRRLLHSSLYPLPCTCFGRLPCDCALLVLIAFAEHPRACAPILSTSQPVILLHLLLHFAV
jgi:hypothetical protein